MKNFTSLLILLLGFAQQQLCSQCWNLVWADEFDGTTLSTDWSYQTGGGGWGNNELQNYTNRTDNTTVSDGTLKIIAREEAFEGANYTSARLRSINQGDWTYGKFEASIKLPIGQGIWPAFWMMPTDNVYGGWPTSGEIDIMEYLGHQPTISYGTAHWGLAWNNKGSSGGSVTNPSGNLSDVFHTYTMEWDSTQIRWSFDGTQFHVVNKAEIQAPFFWPFDYDFHFILNVAVGGNWPGNPDASTVFPQTMEVEYVRVYQLLGDIEINGKAIVLPLSAGTIYTAPDIQGATYAWNVPGDATIIAGAGTPEITVDWGYASGGVEVEITTPCGTTNKTFPVKLTPNLTPNPGFEQGMTNWGSNAYDGAVANFYIDESSPFLGGSSFCADVSTLGANGWNAQLYHPQVATTSGEEYVFRFWAKANILNKTLTLSIINATTYAYYGSNVFTLTDQWAEYSYYFTAPATTTCAVNFDLGYNTGIFCIDQFYYAPNTPLPSALTDIDVQTSTIEIFSDINNNLLVLKGVMNDYEIEVLDSTGNVLMNLNNQRDELLVETDLLGSGIFFIKIVNTLNGNLWVEKFAK